MNTVVVSQMHMGYVVPVDFRGRKQNIKIRNKYRPNAKYRDSIANLDTILEMFAYNLRNTHFLSNKCIIKHKIESFSK